MRLTYPEGAVLKLQYTSLSAYLPFVRLRNLNTTGPVGAGILLLSQKPVGIPRPVLSSPVQAAPASPPKRIVPEPESVPEEAPPPSSWPELAPELEPPPELEPKPSPELDPVAASRAGARVRRAVGRLRANSGRTAACEGHRRREESRESHRDPVIHERGLQAQSRYVSERRIHRQKLVISVQSAYPGKPTECRAFCRGCGLPGALTMGTGRGLIGRTACLSKGATCRTPPRTGGESEHAKTLA